MSIEMISPRTVYNRRPLGRHIVDTKINSEDEPNQEFWSVRTIDNKETELYIRGRHVVLHYFTAIDHTHIFTGYTDTPIICAVFICLSHMASSNASISSIFENESETHPSGVMLFTDNVGKYYGLNSEIFSCKLPFKIGHAWPIRNCLLVEQVRDGSSKNSLFAMTHCLAEFTPVIFVDELGNKGFVNDPRVRIVTLCEESLLLLAFSETDKTFTLWRLRDAIRTDFDELYDVKMDGSVTAKTDHQTRFATSVQQNEKMNLSEDCHTSKEYFECYLNSTRDADIKTIDDLDLRSPLVRSFKSITDAEPAGKRSSMHNVLADIRMNRSKAKNFKDRLCQEPLYPKICLQQVSGFKPHSLNSIFDPSQMVQHSTPMNSERKANIRSASPSDLLQEPKGFFAEDFYKRKYLCFIQNAGNHNLLQIVKFNYYGNTFMQFQEERYRILDAIYLNQLKLIVILEENRTISLYTGISFICKISLLNAMVYEPDLFANMGQEMSISDINSLVRMSEATDTGFTLHSKTGLALRLYLPEMVRFYLVKKCLLTLKKLLPINVGTILLCRWYSLNRAVDNNETISAEWPRFVDFLLENLGFRKHKQRDSYIIGNVKDLSLNNSDISMEEICSKRSRVNRSLYSIETRTKDRDQLGAFSTLAFNISDQPLVEYASTVLYSLHMVYETEKLNYSSCLYLENLAALNCSLAYCTESSTYLEYYMTDYPDLWPKVNKLPSITKYLKKENIWDDSPPDLSRWFYCLMTGIIYDKKYPIIEDLNELSMNLINLWLVIFCKDKLLDNIFEEINKHMYRIKFNATGTPEKYTFNDTNNIVRALDNKILKLNDIYQRAACYLCEIGFTVADLDKINPGLAGIIKTICFYSSSYPPDFCNQNLYHLLHRSDLEKQRSLIMPIIKESRITEVITSPPKTFRRLSEVRQNCYSYWSNNVQYSRGIPTTIRKNRNVDSCYLLGLLQDDPIIRLSYPDVRVGEAYKMLQSSSPVELDVSICSRYTIEGDSPPEALKDELDLHLKAVTSQRTFALAFGRGMLGLHVLNSNSLTDTLYVPPLCLSGKYLLSDSGKPHTIENPTSLKPWPCFHNGTAAGLMISPMNHLVDYVWILKQCPSNQLDKIDLSPEKAGVLFGLGLNGHLNKLSHATIGDIIKSMNEMATMAVLISLSAFNLGSKNIALSKHISFHYRCLIPEEKDHNEQIPSLCQVSAIISAGLLNFKSGDRKMAKIFIEEMGRSREFLTPDGSSPVDIELTSATAGFSVGLIMFQQGNIFSREYNCEELNRLMKYLKGGYRFPAKENICSEAPSDQNIRTLLKNFDIKKPQPICKIDNWNNFQTTNSRVLEGEYYNKDITGPGAAVALGMIYMASNDEVIARELASPETFKSLDEIGSPLHCFRQIAWGMVMWNKIQPTREWIENTIPSIVSSNALKRNPDEDQIQQSDTANECYFQLLAGSCFVMGMRFAGTDNSEARNTIMFYINKLLAIKNDSELNKIISHHQYEWALCTIFLSACMVSAGTGNLCLLKIVRALRSIHHPKDFANYGINTAYSMAIGLLFLGGGKLTLSNSPRCAAILLISFFPRLSPTYNGKRYHLQALRHLYVIATRPRVMCAVDIDTLTAVPISSSIVLKTETRNYNGCFVYPPEDPANITSIEFFHKDGKYCPQIYKPGTESWNILRESLLTGGYLFVQNKSHNKDLRTILGKFNPDKMLRGFELCDYDLMINFLDAMQCGEINAVNQHKIVTHLVSKTNGLKQILARIRLLDINKFEEVCRFYDHCQEIGKLRILSVFLVYLNVTLVSLNRIANGKQDRCLLLSDESQILMDYINE